jgi:hypothetical protein
MNMKAVIFSEFFHYFHQRSDYVLCLNHLDELKWLPVNKVAEQFEFFPLEKKQYESLAKKILTAKIRYSSDREEKIRRTVRQYLKWKYENADPDSNEEIDRDLFERIEKIHFYLHEKFIRKSKFDKKWIFLVLGIFIVFLIFFAYIESNKPASLLVLTGSVSADVYLDSMYVGKSNQILNLHSTGLRKITVHKSGYISSPAFRKMVLKRDSLIKVNFKLIPKGKEKYGYLKLLTNVNEANVFIDDKYYGNLMDFEYIRLLEGEHKVEVRKSYYVIDPPFRFVHVKANDTTAIHFDLSLPADNFVPAASSERFYSLEIQSNIPGARIYINGKETEYTTDHIFTDIKPGSYVVKLKKEGYKFTPASRQISISRKQPIASLMFSGERVVNNVILRVHPEQAVIIIDRKIKAKGVFKGQLLIGEHEIAFEIPPGYAEMAPQKIVVISGTPLEKDFYLVPLFNYFIKVQENGNIESEKFRLKTGFVEEVRGFKYSSNVGPDVVFEKTLNTYVWKFGFAFPYRNPQGSDAIQITFTNKFDLKHLHHIKLIIVAGITGEKYPMRLVQKTAWKVIFNNFKLHDLQQINGSKPGELIKYTWDVTKLVRLGPNMLEISTAPDNNTFIFIKEIRITNQE